VRWRVRGARSDRLTQKTGCSRTSLKNRDRRGAVSRVGVVIYLWLWVRRTLWTCTVQGVAEVREFFNPKFSFPLILKFLNPVLSFRIREDGNIPSAKSINRRYC
jgi:hypothetical protein